MKNLIRKFFLHPYAYKKMIFNRQSYLHASGWMESLQLGRPSDQTGNSVPLMSYAVIAFLNGRLSSDLTMFEFGSGYSTLFYAERVKSITSVEHDESWHRLLAKMLPDNAQVNFVAEDADGQYCRNVADKGEYYDVIVIDGRDRLNCLRQSLHRLTDSGVILLDDSQGPNRLEEASKLTKAAGFREISFEGLKPGKTNCERTTIFYRDGNCFSI